MDFAAMAHELDAQARFKRGLLIIVFLAMSITISLLIVCNHNQRVAALAAVPAPVPPKTVIELLGPDATPEREIEATSWRYDGTDDRVIFTTDVGEVYWSGSFVVLSPDMVRKATAAPAAAPAPTPAPPVEDHEAAR